MSGFFFFSKHCADAVLCCFPRVLSWIRPLASPPLLFAERVTDGNEQVGNGASVPSIPGYGKRPDDPQSDWIALSSCGIRSFGIRADGSLWGWGSKFIGDGSMKSYAVPKLVDEGPWTHVSTSASHTLAIKSDGTMWAWGSNVYGQCGQGYIGFSSDQHVLKARAKLSTTVASVTVVRGGTYKLKPSVSFVVQDRPSTDTPSFGTGYTSRGLLAEAVNRDAEGASGATGEAVMSYRLSSCTLTSPGSGYTATPVAKIASTELPESEAVIRTTARFEIVSVAVQSGGYGYTSPPTVSISLSGQGFEAEAVVENGSVVAVNVINGGLYQFQGTNSNSTPQEQHTREVTFDGDGTGAQALAFLGNGYVHSVEVNSLGSGYRDIPEVSFVGGGEDAEQATLDAEWLGSVAGVLVTDGGSGYTENRHSHSVDGSTGTRYVNVAFDRDPEDDFVATAQNQGDAVAAASLTPAKVSSVEIGGTGLDDPYFDAVDGTVSAFSDVNVGVAVVTGTLTQAIVEAKIVGGGLTWDGGIPVTCTLQASGELYSLPLLSFSGSDHQFTSKPHIAVKLTDGTNPLPSAGSVATITVADGTDWVTKTQNARGEALTVSSSSAYGLAYSLSKCSNTCIGVQTESHDDADIIGLYNSTGGALVPGSFVSLFSWPEQENQQVWTGAQAVGVGARLSGSPSLSVVGGDAKISLVDNFDGVCTWRVDSRGSEYNQVEQYALPSTAGSVAYCPASDVQPSIAAWTRPVTGARDVASTRSPELSLSNASQSPAVKFCTVEIPAAAWRGEKSDAISAAYCVFGDDERVEHGMWVATREETTQSIAGGEYAFEPLVTVLTDAIPVPVQVPGAWKHCTARGSTREWRTSSGYNYSEEPAAYPSTSVLSFAVDDSGEVYGWGSTTPRFSGVVSQEFPDYYYTTRGSLWSSPTKLGSRVEIECTWNKESIPNANSYTLRPSRFFVPDSPTSLLGSKPSEITSVRRCESQKLYPDSVPKSYFGTGGYSSDEKGLNSFGPATDGDHYGIVPFVSTFSGPASTTHAGGHGYTTAPDVWFAAYGSPLVDVSASLVESPSFDECDGRHARASSGQLWSVDGGWVLQGEPQAYEARRVTFTASGLFDSWVMGFSYSTGYGAATLTPDVSSDPWVKYQIGPASTRSPGDVSFSGTFCKSTASVTHTTTERVELAQAFAIIFDDGGEGFDDYSTWRIRITPPQRLSLSDDGGQATFTLSPLSQTEESLYVGEFKYYSQFIPATRSYYQCRGLPYSTPDPVAEDYAIPPKNVYVAPSVSFERNVTIARTSVSDQLVTATTWRGSLYATGVSGVTSIATALGQQSQAPSQYLDGGKQANVLLLSGGPFDADESPTIAFECISGNGTYTSLPSYRIVAIRKTPVHVEGLTQFSGNWSCYDIESSSRKLAKVAFPEAKGVAAPIDEQGFEVIRSNVGLKSDGSLWSLGDMTSASRVMGNLELTIDSRGGGYEAPVTAVVSPQLPGVATATATLDGRLVAIGVDFGGSGYRTPPELTIEGNATATAVIAGPVDKVTMTDYGSGYRAPPRVRFSGKGFTAFGTAVVSGSIDSVEIIDGGSGYTSPPQVAFEGGGTGAAATASISGIVHSISMTSRGAYERAPTVTISGGGGDGATAVAHMRVSGTKKYVAWVEITDPGSGYSSAPNVTFSGGGGSGAVAVATINAAVVAVSVTNGGSDYGESARVLIQGNATAVARLSFSVSDVEITDGGSYREPPTVTFEPTGSISSLSLDSEGSGYTSAPEVVIAGGVGSGATAVAVIDGKVSSVTVTSSGQSYKSPPAVVFSGSFDPSIGSPAAATAVLDQDGGVASITVTDQGGGYRSAPTVSLVGGNGTGATASVVLDATIEKVVLTAVGSRYDADAPPSVLFVGGGGTGATATLTIETSGEGADAACEIDGSIIYATITEQGSGYESSPAISVSDSTNARIQHLEEGENAEDYRAVLKSAIEGTVSAEIEDGGENYIAGEWQGDRDSQCDRHGKRVSGGARYAGGRCSRHTRLSQVTTQTSTSTNGGGTVQSLGTTSQTFSAKPSVHFPNTVGVLVETRLKVSSLGIKKGSSYETDSLPLSTLASKMYPVQHPALTDDGSYVVFWGDEVTTRYKHQDVEYGTSSARGAPAAEPVQCEVYLKSIDPWKFVYDQTTFDLARKSKFTRAPQFAVDSERGHGGASSITLSGEKIADSVTGSPPASHSPRVGLAEEATDYSSGFVGRTTTPGIVKVVQPTFEVTVEDGSVTAVSITDYGTLRDHLKNCQGNLSWISDLIVHGGGGSGARLTFAEVYTGWPEYDDVDIEVVVEDGGGGYGSEPSVMFVPRLTIASRVAYAPIYGEEHSSIDESEWPVWLPVLQSSATCQVEYVAGTTEDDYVTLYENFPVTDDGIFPMFKDGFVSDVFLTDGGAITADFAGPAFVQAYAEAPTVTLVGSMAEGAEEASVTASVVTWSSTFSGRGATVAAVRE